MYGTTNDTCFPDLKTSPTVFCRSCDPKPNREKRDAPPDTWTFPCASGDGDS